jgi:hypothetical protein
MDQAALGIPHILTIERYDVALAQSLDSRRQIDVVSYQDRLSRSETKNESLVPASFDVIGQDPSDNPFTFDLDIAGAAIEGPPDGAAVAGCVVAAGSTPCQRDSEKNECGDANLLHGSCIFAVMIELELLDEKRAGVGRHRRSAHNNCQF